MKHTPGPWSVRKGVQRLVWYVEGSSNPWLVAETGGQSEPVNEANARLIAAAPELLEACKAAKDYLVPDLVEPGRTAFWKLVAAIAKAEGREHEKSDS